MKTLDLTLNKAPDIAQGLGQMTAVWTTLEWHLLRLFTILLGAPPNRARVMFYTHQTHRAKADLIRALSQHVIRRKSDRMSLDDLLEKIRKTSGRRNKHAHQHRAVLENGETGLFDWSVKRADQALKAATAKHLRQLSTQIEKWCVEVHCLLNQLRS